LTLFSYLITDFMRYGLHPQKIFATTKSWKLTRKELHTPAAVPREVDRWAYDIDIEKFTT